MRQCSSRMTLKAAMAAATLGAAALAANMKLGVKWRM